MYINFLNFTKLNCFKFKRISYIIAILLCFTVRSYCIINTVLLQNVIFS